MDVRKNLPLLLIALFASGTAEAKLFPSSFVFPSPYQEQEIVQQDPYLLTHHQYLDTIFGGPQSGYGIRGSHDSGPLYGNYIGNYYGDDSGVIWPMDAMDNTCRKHDYCQMKVGGDGKMLCDYLASTELEKIPVIPGSPAAFMQSLTHVYPGYSRVLLLDKNIYDRANKVFSEKYREAQQQNPYTEVSFERPYPTQGLSGTNEWVLSYEDVGFDYFAETGGKIYTNGNAMIHGPRDVVESYLKDAVTPVIQERLSTLKGGATANRITQGYPQVFQNSENSFSYVYRFEESKDGGKTFRAVPGEARMIVLSAYLMF